MTTPSDDSLRRFKRIKNRDAAPRDVPHVPGRKRQPMNLCGRGQESVDHWKRIRYVQTAPLFRDRQIDNQDARGVIGNEAAQPALERARGRRVTATHILDAPADLADGDNTEQNVVGTESGEP